jgi:hypothetical protein
MKKARLYCSGLSQAMKHGCTTTNLQEHQGQQAYMIVCNRNSLQTAFGSSWTKVTNVWRTLGNDDDDDDDDDNNKDYGFFLVYPLQNISNNKLPSHFEFSL